MKGTEIGAFALGVLVLIVFGLAFAFKAVYENGYKDACRDFYKGKLKYDLVENADGTREWKKIEPRVPHGVKAK